MKISTINNYNNSFKAKNINQNLIYKNNNKKLLQNTDSNFKIAKEMKAISKNCFATGGIMASGLTLQLLDIIPSTVTVAIAAVSWLGLLIASKLAIHSARKSENKKNDLQLPLESVPKEYRHMLKSSDNYEILVSRDSSLIKYAALTGKVDDELEQHFYSVTKNLNKKDYEDVIDYYAKTQLQEDENRQIPMHKYNIEQMRSVVSNLYDYPEFIAEIMLAKDVNGEIPIHKFINDDYSNENLQNFYHIFSDLNLKQQLDCQTILSICETKNRNGVSVNDWLEKHMENSFDIVPNSKIILESLAFAKEDYEEKHGSFQPYIPVSELKHKAYITNKIDNLKEINYKNIMQILNDEEIQKTKGLDLNYSDSYVADIMDFLINFANKDERTEIISKLKELNKIDYDKVNSDGISGLELIINAEDCELLGLVKNNTFRYRPELDYTYENISDENFKKQVGNLDYNFVELREAINSASYRKLVDSIYCVKSPLFNKEKQAQNMTVPSYIHVNSNFASLYNRYNDQLGTDEVYSYL